MRALVMAGGFARRMWPLTLNTPKQLLPLSDGYVILDLVMNGLLAVDLEEVVLSVNERFAGQFEAWASARGLDVRIEAEGALREEEKPGAVGAMARLVSSGSLTPDDYLIVAGDNVTSLDYGRFMSSFRRRSSPMIAVYDVRNRGLAMRYGVVKLGSRGRVESLLEKPQDPPSTLVSTAIYALTWDVLGAAAGYASSGAPVDALGHFIAWLVGEVPVYAHKFAGYWYDVGGMDEYGRVRSLFAEGRIPRPRHIAPPPPADV